MLLPPLLPLLLLLASFPPRCRSNGSDVIPADLVVGSKSGRVRGVRQRAANGKDVDVWWGIPYAEPPIGDLRFRAPKPIKR